MTEEELKGLKELPVPAPAEGAREAAVAAALAAFKSAAAPDVGAPQGNARLPRLRDTTSVSEGKANMRFRRPAVIAASIVVLALVVPITLYLVQAPRTADQGGPQADSRVQEQPWNKVAALSKPASAEAPAPPTGAAPEQLPATLTSVAPPPYLFIEWPGLRAELVACEAVKRKGPTESLTDDDVKCLPFLHLTDSWSVIGQARYDQRIQDVYPFKSQEDRCFVLTASYIETFVENAALDIEPDRTVMLRYELKSPCQYGYRTNALSHFFLDIHRENAPTSGPHVASLGDAVGQVRAPFAKRPSGFLVPAPKIDRVQPSVRETLAPGSRLAKKPGDILLPAPKINRAQPPIYIQSDDLFYDDANKRVIAQGNVEIHYNNYLLIADKVIYDRSANRLTAEGNAQLRHPNGSIARADRFEATDDFRDAFVQSLSVVTQDDTRIAASRAVRKEGNVTSTVTQRQRQDKVAALSKSVPALEPGSRTVKTIEVPPVEGRPQPEVPALKKSSEPPVYFEVGKDFAGLGGDVTYKRATGKFDPVPSPEAGARPVQTVPLAEKRPVAGHSQPDAMPGITVYVPPKDAPVAPPPAKSSSAPPTAVTPPVDAKGIRGFAMGGFSPKAGEPEALIRFGAATKFGDEPKTGEHVFRGVSQATEEGRDRFAAAAANPVKSVASEPVSTFSIDVDSASYAFVRRTLNAGRLPPKAAVRVEEMINYFPYDYPLPEDRSAPFRPTVSVLPSPWNPTNKLVHIAIKGYDVPKSEHPRANLVLLIDTSGSMAPEGRLPLLKNAFRMLIDTLRPEDTVGIVTYAGETHTALEPTKVANKRKILEAIERLQSGGSTAGAAGIQEAYRMAEGVFDKTAVNRVILATDGDFNVGISNVDELKSLIERKRKTGVYLSVLGVGRGNYNDALMQALAQNGNGVAAYIDTLNEARKVLVDEVSSSLFPIAKDVKIQIEFNPALVTEYRLIGYETRHLRREDFNNDKVDAGDIGSGHTVTAIYEVTPVGSPRFVEDLRYRQPAAATSKDDKGEYAFLRINYKLPAETVSRRIELAITPALEEPAIDQVPTDVRFSIAVAAFGQLLRGEPYLKGFGYDEAIALAAAARGDDLFAYRAEFLNLVRLAKTARP